MMRVLITGAAGVVAPGVIRTLRQYYNVKLLDLVKSDQFPEHEWVLGSILDRTFLENAVHDVQAVVHCAATRKMPGRVISTEQFFDVNVKGLYLLLEACKQAQIHRFVHVSSTAPVIGHWHKNRNISIHSPYTTQGRYSLTKMLQEEICEHIARNSDMTVVALRLWVPCEGPTMIDDTGTEVPRPYHPGLIDTNDFGEACHLALSAEHLQHFELFHVVATEEARQRFDADRTKELLGFKASQDFSSLVEM